MTAPAGQAANLAAYQQSTAVLRQQVKDYLLAVWASLGYYGSKQLPDFLDLALPQVQGAMAQMQAVTAAHLATQAALGGASATPIPTRTLTTNTVRNGADPAEVYGRPFHLVWRQIGAAKQTGTGLTDQALDDAIEAGANRAVQLALTDLQLAKTHTAQEILSTTKGRPEYRRVLEGAHSCALCIVASTQRYHRAQLLPIHPGCDCGIEEIEPGTPHVVDENRLAAAHAAIEAQYGTSSAGARVIPKSGGTKYSDVLIVHEHGELGPVLAVRGRPFTGPNDLN